MNGGNDKKHKNKNEKNRIRSDQERTRFESVSENRKIQITINSRGKKEEAAVV